MRNLTKASREASRTAQFEYLINKGYSREIYKALDFFTIHEGKYYTLKIYRGTAANPEHYVNYRTEEARAQAIQNYKANYESREAYKAEQKIKNKGRLSSHAATAAAIREELKKNFAGVKFSVTSESYAGGDSCRISWTDGPTTREVEAITGKYQYGSFDGMTDCYNYTNSREDIPQTKYVSESRSISEEIEKIVISGLMELKTYNEEELNDFSRTGPKQQAREILAVTAIPLDYTEAKVITDHSDSLNYFKLVFTTPEQPKAKQPQGAEATEAGEVNIVDYSEKAFAVIGDFSGHYDNLINLGGKYNKFLKCGRGIIFSKTKLEAVKNYFEAITPQEQPAESGETISLSNLSELINQKKSPECSHVLQTMDRQEIPNYHQAIKETLQKYPNANLNNLETELNKYI